MSSGLLLHPLRLHRQSPRRSTHLQILKHLHLQAQTQQQVQARQLASIRLKEPLHLVQLLMQLARLARHRQTEQP